MSTYITKRKGEKAVLNTDKIKATLERACLGIPHVDPQVLFEYVVKHIYEGITSKDIEALLITSAETFIERSPEYGYVAAQLFLFKLKKEVFGHSIKDKDVDQQYRQAFKDSIGKGIDAKILDPRIGTTFDLEFLADCLEINRDNLLDYMGIQVLYERYFTKVGEVRMELPQIFWMRVAMGLSLNEKDPNVAALRFYSNMSNLYAVPSTPTLFHSGFIHSQMASCYLGTTQDDLRDIFKVVGDNAQMAKYSGGIGTDVTNIRATGAFINSTKVESQGVVPFLKIMNDTTMAINRSGKRRGAAAVYLENWHYDTEDFIDLKRNTGDERRRTHDLNTALWISDLFMQRVEQNGNWTLFSPDEVPDLHHIYGKTFRERYEHYEKLAEEGKIRLFKVVKAKMLWRKMLTSLYETGGPWITFKCPSNVRSPQNHTGVVHNSNLCTEILENNSQDEVAVCNLASLNLGSFVSHTTDGEAYVNFTLLEEVIRTTVRGLDNVIDLNFYPIPETKTSNMRHRPVGMGLMGWQDMLFKLKIPFDSPEAIRLADGLMEFISYHAISTSADLAEEKGAYSTFKGSKWDRGIFPVDSLDILEDERGEKIDVSRESLMGLDWAALKEKVKSQGMRNSLLMAVAPTASIGNLVSAYPCIEPIYKNIYTKSNRNGEFTVINKYLVNDLRGLGLWSDEMLDKIKSGNGSIQHIREIPKKLRDLYKEAFEIDAVDQLKLTAVRGKWIDQSQSHNVFLPAGVSGKTLSNVYLTAWRMGLKTTYYLRTLGVSQIEKATTVKPKEVQACSIDNPECESCQ